MAQTTPPSPVWAPVRIAGSYAAVAAAWIYGSDALLAVLPSSLEESRRLGTAKGLLFVLFTSVSLWALLGRLMGALRRSDAALRLTQFCVDHAPDAVYWIDQSGRFVYVNEVASGAFGYSRDELLQMTISDIDAQCTPANWRARWAELQQQGAVRFETEQRRKDGSVVPVEVSAKAVDWESSQLVCAFVRNTQERKNAETQGLELTRRMLLLFDSMPGYAFIKDRNSAYVIANRRLCDDLGVAPTEIRGKTDYQFQAPEAAARMEADDRTVLETRRPLYLDEQYVEVHGEARWFTTRKVPLLAPDGTAEGLMGLAVDVTERKRAQLALRESERRFEQALIGSPIPVMMHAEGGTILLLSQSWTELSGYSAMDIPNVSEWIEKASGHVESARGKLVRNYDLGERTDEGMVPIRTKAGTERTWNLFSAPLGQMPDGRRIVLTMAIDVTERALLEQQFLQAQKMEAVGRLAGGVAHDFNNLLTVILGYAQLLASSVTGDDCDLIAEVTKAAERGAALTTQLLAFSRQQVLQQVILDANTSIRSLERMLRRIIGEDIKLEVDLSAEANTIRIDPTQLDQVLLNLSVNARDAMPDGGTLRISTERLSVEDGASVLGLPAGAWVVVRVSDTGFGMTPEVRERLFEPFFTTKERGKGTGLGLSTVHGIVQQAGGLIHVTSKLGEGSTFAVYLPGVQAETSEPTAKAPTASLTEGRVKVLVVEDDAAVRPLIVKILTDAGFEVATAVDASEAMEVVEAGGIDVVLTDVIMPGISGVELARQLSQRVPQIPFVFMSGYAPGTTTASQTALPPGAPFLQKPFKPEMLVAHIREAVERSSSAESRQDDQ